MLDRVQKLGFTGIYFCRQLGISALFLLRVLLRSTDLRKDLPLLVEQIYFVGVLSVAIIVVSALFIGMVVALQGYNTLQRFGAQAELGQLVALSVVRELGPVVAALLFIGRACSAITAEIGLMQATEQLTSMEMMAVDPLRRVIFPRFWAGFITMPILAVIFNVVAIYGAYILGVLWLGIDSGTFWSNMQASVSFRMDVVNGIIKSVVFGFVAAWIAIYQGYFAVPTAEGVSRAATRTVVYSSVAILGLDFILTTMMLEVW